MNKVPVDRELLLFLNGEAELDGMAFGEHPPRKPFWWRKYLRDALSAQPAEADGVEVVATVHIGDPCPETGAHDDLELLPEDCEFYDGECLIRQTDHLAALSAVTAERDRLLQDSKRYRWLREHACNEWYMDQTADLLADSLRLDKTIDAAMDAKEE